MAQSSNYKQYNRTTRVLTEESGFSGGMFWTGNNIDETHLKSIVNCDYDDTTGYLKTRDSFEPVINSPNVEVLKNLNVNLHNLKLLGVYNLCAFKEDDSLTEAGYLYIFAQINFIHNSTSSLWRATLDNSTRVDQHGVSSTINTYVCLFQDSSGVWHKCETESGENLLYNINKVQLLTLYDNHLYGLGPYPRVVSPNPETPVDDEQTLGLKVFRLMYTAPVYSDDAPDVPEKFTFKSLDYSEILSKINNVTLLEATVSGFNAAKGKNAFNYTGQQSDNPHIIGVYYTDEQGNVIVSPRIGQRVWLNIVVDYTEGTNHLALFQLKEGSDTTDPESIWQLVEIKDSATGLFSFDFIFQKKETTFLYTFYGTNNVGNTPTAYSENAVDWLGPIVVTANDTLANLKLKTYDLSSVTGNCLWRNRLCVWGVTGNTNCLFLSEVDNFYYFPVPHNVAVFDTNVISCIPYKDTLLVFTADKIYRMAENNDGTFTQSVIQNDMPLSPADAAHLTAIKNMVLFKSGNYFYMIVPKSQSLTDELIIAPIYKNIAGFLNTLDKSVLEVLQLLYPEYLFDEELNLNKGYSFIDNNGLPEAIYSAQDTVYILYKVNAVVRVSNYADTPSVKNLSFKLFLNYNTNLRAWTLYIEDTTEYSLDVAALTTARQMSFVRVKQTNLSAADTYSTFSVVTQSYAENSTNEFRILLDTGYRTLSSTVQKRFREVQLKLYSTSENITSFGTAFLVDGIWRRNYIKLQETLYEDNKVSLFPALDLNTFVTELSIPVDNTGNIVKSPGSDAIELSDWTLDFSHFKREAPITIRVPVSGKGFNPRFILMAPKAKGLTINEINWVYRLMHGR